MGVKVSGGASCIAGELKNGVLSFSIGKSVFEVKVPAIQRMSFPKQCSHFVGDNVFALLANETHCIVLRFDGTGVVYLKKGKVLCLNFKYDLPKFGFGFERGGGVVQLDRDVTYMNTMLYTNNGKDYIFGVVNYPLSITYNVDDNPLYVGDLGEYVLEGRPELKLKNDKIQNIGSIGVNLYAIDGEYQIGKSIVYLE